MPVLVVCGENDLVVRKFLEQQFANPMTMFLVDAC